MNSSDQPTKLPLWLLVAIYLALIATAAGIYRNGGNPLPPLAIVAIITCVLGGAMVVLVPMVMWLERAKNAALDERQQQLEALSRTVTASAEQIGIAANGLYEISDLVQKNIKQADQLPHKLQEKIAEFQAQLANVAETDKEELERELLALRTTESERLESVSQRIAKSSAEWSKLEAATHQHLTTANEAVAKLAMGTANAIGKAQAAAEQALTQARTEAARSIGEASGQATRAIEAAKAAALADFEHKLSDASQAVADRLAGSLAAKIAAATTALEATIARLEATTRQAAPTAATPNGPEPALAEVHTPAAAAPAAIEPPAQPPVAEAAPAETAVPADAAPAPAAAEAPAPAEPAAPSVEAAAPAVPKRPRKPRRETPPTPESAAPAEESAIAVNGTAPAESSVSAEPAPVPADRIAEITPVAPHTNEPFTAPDASEPKTNGAAPDESSPASHDASGTSTPGEPAATPAPRKRAPKKTVADDEPHLGLDLGDTESRPEGNGIERTLTSDGATRLIVTAYIGIGNRLFIRGNGPGLSWEKGVPLQFISIGKWRWETAEAGAPVQFKLYKNDEQECASLGAQSIDPGHQQEMTAAF